MWSIPFANSRMENCVSLSTGCPAILVNFNVGGISGDFLFCFVLPGTFVSAVLESFTCAGLQHTRLRVFFSFEGVPHPDTEVGVITERTGIQTVTLIFIAISVS